MMETIKLILNLFRCRFIFIQTYFGQLHTPFRKPRHDPRDGSVLYPQLYSIEIENVNVILKFLVQGKFVGQNQVSLVNVETDGVNGTSEMKFSSSPASSNSTLNCGISLKRFATTDPPI